MMITLWFLVYLAVGDGADGRDMEKTLAVYTTQEECVQVVAKYRDSRIQCHAIDRVIGVRIKDYHAKDYT